MVGVLGASHGIDALSEGHQAFLLLPEEAAQLRDLVIRMNAGTIGLRHFFHHQKAVFMFNFVPSTTFFSTSALGRHVSQGGLVLPGRGPFE